MRKPRIVSSDFARINGGKDLARIFTLLLEQASLSGRVDDVRLLELHVVEHATVGVFRHRHPARLHLEDFERLEFRVAAIQEILRHALLKPLGVTHTVLAEVVWIDVNGLVPLPAAAAGVCPHQRTALSCIVTSRTSCFTLPWPRSWVVVTPLRSFRVVLERDGCASLETGRNTVENEDATFPSHGDLPALRRESVACRRARQWKPSGAALVCGWRFVGKRLEVCCDRIYVVHSFGKSFLQAMRPHRAPHNF